LAWYISGLTGLPGNASQQEAHVPIRTKARSAVLAEWDSWSRFNPGDAAAHAPRFYCHLLENRPDLLDFRYSTADKSQLIQSWLLTAGRIKSSG
jgi:hypothetical protein